MTRVNLLSPRLPSRQAVRFRRLVRTCLIMGWAVGLSVLAYISVLMSHAVTLRALEAVQADIAAEEAPMAVWQSLSAQMKAVETREALLDTIPQGETRFTTLVTSLAAEVPAGCQLMDLIIEPGEVINVTGRATSHSAVANYLSQMRAQPILAGIELQSSAQSADGSQVSFRLRGAAVPADGGEGGQEE